MTLPPNRLPPHLQPTIAWPLCEHSMQTAREEIIRLMASRLTVLSAVRTNTPRWRWLRRKVLKHDLKLLHDTFNDICGELG